jgi:late competence protein required for DNA uptake (superfamily II DNA/RNA helicase)
MDTENIVTIEQIIKNFLEQQNNNKLKLLIFINNNSNLFEILNVYNNKNENKKCFK